MPSFNIIHVGLLVLEKKIKILKVFYWARRPSWSCDLDHLYKHPGMLHMKFGFDWLNGFREEDLKKSLTDDDGRTPEHGYASKFTF